MKKLNLLRFIFFIAGSIFVLASCSSLEEARSLHNQGKDGEALKMAAKYLKDGDPAVRIEAANLVGSIGGDEAGKLLMPVMDDEDAEVQVAAIDNIGKIKYEPASKKLVAMSISTDGDVFEAVGGAIRNIGAPAIELLVKRYNSTSDTAEKNAYKKAMFEVGPSVAASIAKSLAGKSFFENRGNFELLIAFKNPMVAQWMLDEIENEAVADMVVEALVKLGKQAVVPIVNKLQGLKGREGFAELKSRLIRALGEIKDRSVVPLLEEFSKDDIESVSNAAELSLRKVRGF
ncbi:HEAT repeat domain-containing protein [bacterium]|nr:HEAT repeat domain-containing protein [bacterium]